MPRNSSGQYILPAGNPVTTGTVISSSIQNTTMSDVGTELTSSLDRSGRGPMLAPLALVDGTASVPGVGFNAEPGTGLYRAGTNDLRVQVGGSTIAQFVPTGPVLPTGITVTQSATNTAAITATGNGTGPGVTATGGPGGAVGVLATGTVASAGLWAHPGPSSPYAINSDGHVQLTGAAMTGAPNVSVADKTITYANVVRVGGSFEITHAVGAQTIKCGYNVAGVSLAADKRTLTVSFSGVTFTSLYSYWLAVSLGSPTGDVNGYALGWGVKQTTSFQLHIFDTSTGITLDLTTTPTYFIIDFEAKGF